MNEKYPHIFSPIRIGGVQFKNRIMASPTLPAHSDSNGLMTEDYVANFEVKALGGAGVVTVGETAVDWEYGKSHGAQIKIWGEEAGVHLANLADKIHRGGALASIQLCHGGIWSQPEYNGGNNPIGPSACIRPDGMRVDGMTEYQIEKTADTFAQAAFFCKNAGFDMAMVHGGHGWLISTFLSPFNNQRTDKWGGSPENRARFPLLILDKIRDAVGRDFLLDFRISIKENLEGGAGISEEEVLNFIRMMEGRIDMISPSKGNRWNVKLRGDGAICSIFSGYAPNLDVANIVRQGGIKLPIVSMGGLNNPDVTEQLLAEGAFDFAGIGRGLISEPDWVNKLARGKRDEMRPCLRCSRCADIANGRDNKEIQYRFDASSTHRFTCSINPEAGRWHYNYRPAGPSRSVAVVGGGPAGMQAAITAAQRGHKVTLFEKNGYLGGQLRFSDYIPFKYLIREFKEYQIRMLDKLGVEVKLGVAADKETLSGFDSAIIAIGAQPIVPPIPNLERSNAIYASDVFGKEDQLGKNVVIIGGGQVGCETALHLAMLGHSVSVIEMKDLVASDCIFTARVPLVLRLENHNVDCLTECTCIDVLDAGVKIRKKDGSEDIIAADSIIVAAGMSPLWDEADAFEAAAVPDIKTAGDCISAKSIYQATSTGYDAAINIV